MKQLRIFILSLAFLFPGLSFIPATPRFDSEVVVDFGGDVDMDNSENGSELMGDKDSESLVQGFNSWIQRYKRVVTIVLGLATLTMFIVFMFSLTGIAANSTNPRGRAAYITRTLICFVVFGILGSFTVVFAMAFDIFR